MVQVEDLRWKKFPVLEGGFVTLVDVMGDDDAIVQAARVSYGKGTKTPSDDRTLIRYLMRHRHTTPFEMAEVKFLVRVPMDIWRQWIRHRTASVNEYSTRYSLAIEDNLRTPPDKWRLQSSINKQGSEGFLDEVFGQRFSEEEAYLQEQAYAIYLKRVDMGIAREQARKDLPLSTFTEAYWKIDLHNLLHFLALRMDDSAQFEIREYAKTIGYQIVAPLFPLTWEAFLDYRIRSVVLSKLDRDVIRRLSENKKLLGTEEDFLEAQPNEWKDLKRCREREECLEKLRGLGLISG